MGDFFLFHPRYKRNLIKDLMIEFIQTYLDWLNRKFF